MLKSDELYGQMATLHARYLKALASHQLGDAIVAQHETGKLVCENFSNVVAAIELWAFPQSHGALPDEERASELGGPRPNGALF